MIRTVKPVRPWHLNGKVQGSGRDHLFCINAAFWASPQLNRRIALREFHPALSALGAHRQLLMLSSSFISKCGISISVKTKYRFRDKILNDALSP